VKILLDECIDRLDLENADKLSGGVYGRALSARHDFKATKLPTLGAHHFLRRGFHLAVLLMGKGGPQLFFLF
jgi:hypothetical protein